MKTICYKLIFQGLVLLFVANSSAQSELVFENSSHRYTSDYLVQDLLASSNPNYDAIITLPNALNIDQYRIKKTRVILKFYATWPKEPLPLSATEDFNFELALQLYKGHRSLPFDTSGSIRLNINPNQPLSVFTDNFDAHILGEHDIDIANNSFYLDLESLTDTYGNYSSGTFSWNDLLNTLRVAVEYIIEYEIDVANEIFAPTQEKATILPGRLVSFSWDNFNRDFPAYHFQLAKLYNIDESTTDEYQDITAEINWDRALNIYTDGNINTLDLTIGEGTGFYIWRVRPLGTYYVGRESNSRNFGRWSSENYDNAQLSTINITRTQAESSSSAYYPFFFFLDPDQDKNYIYSRKFTEQNRVSEQMTFASSLLHTKQIHSSNYAQNKTLITQSVPDLTGRPALTTLPVPLSSDNTVINPNFIYKPNFLTRLSSSTAPQVYTAWDYDQDTNAYDPSEANDGINSAFSYYSNSNANPNIPDAEGYPYSRSLYYNDGTNRIKEQSGVGKTHMIAPQQTNHSGRTVRTFYATPAETELVRLFGDEAPSQESVLKTITIDQNNTAQIVYTDRSGQTMATAVSFLDNGLTSSLSVPENTFENFPVEDKVVHNVRVDEGFTSTKRLGVLKETPININYKIKCNILQGLCVNTVVDCGYELQIYLHNLTTGDSGLLHQQDIDSNCDGNGEITLNMPIARNLQPGNYLIEKKLIMKEPPSAQVAIAVDRVNEQIEPLTNLIYSWYNQMESIEDILDFKDSLEELEDDVANLSSNDLKSKYSLPNSFEKTEDHLVYPIYTSISPPDGSQTFQAPTQVIVASSCCTITIPVGFVPDIVKPDDDDYIPVEKNGQTGFQPNPYYFIQPENTEFPLDLEGYSISYLRFAGCTNPEQLLYGIPAALIPAPLLRSFSHRIKNGELALMEGWEQGDLNWTVYHMLMDEYTVDGSETTTPVVKKQYTFDEIIDCWTSILVNLRDLACDGGDYGEPPYNVSDNVDDADYEVNNDPDETRDNDEIHDDHVDDEFGDLSWGMRLLLGIAGASGKVRDAQNQKVGGTDPPAALFYPHHPIKQFLDCTGYKFAKILTPEDPCPLPQDAESGRLYQVGNGTSISCSATGNILMKYDPDPNFSPKNIDQEFFPGVRDPHFAFKYFTYGYEQSGINGVDLKFPDLELMTCFNDPNICEDVNGNPVPCCPDEPDDLCNFCGIGIIECEQTHQDWSGGQRYSFFETIRNYVEQDINVSSDYENVNCDDFRTDTHPATDANGRNWIRYNLDKLKESCESSCDSRRQIFKDSLVSTLRKNCYVIGECRTSDPSDAYKIPVEDLEAMVDAMVEHCKTQCDVTTYRCIDTKQCRPVDKSKTEFDAIQDFITYRELEFGVGDPTNYPRDNCVELTGTNAGIWICNPTNSASNTETVLRRQAMSWLPEISIAPMCNINPDCDEQCPASFSANNDITEISDADKDRIKAQSGQLYDPTGTTQTQPIKSDAVLITTTVNDNE